MSVGASIRTCAYASLLFASAFAQASTAPPGGPSCITTTSGTDASGLPRVTPILGDSEAGFVLSGNLVVTGIFLSVVLHPGVCIASGPSTPGDPTGGGSSSMPTGPAGPP